MANKKKYLGGLKVLLLLLFGMLFATCSTCYASISEEYFDYAISTLAENLVDTNATYQSKARAKLASISGDSTTKTAILNNINLKLENAGKSSLSDVQCIFNASTFSSSTFTISIYFFNNSVPGQNTELTFYRVLNNYIKSNSYENGDTYYYMIITLEYSGTWVGYTNLYNTNGNATMNTLNASFSTSAGGSTILNIPSCACHSLPIGYAQSPLNSSNNIVQVVLYDSNGNYQIKEPDEPSGDIGSSTGTITNPSGEVTDQIDLTNIENGINDINNNLNNIENKIPTSGEIQNVISGEVGKITETITSQPNLNDTIITSGDITNALGFEIEEDKYRNFWFTLTNDFKNALLGTKRTIDVSFQNRTWTISLDDFAVLPNWLKIILTPFSTCFFTWTLVRWWKLIIDKLSSGNVDTLLKENSEEGISNLL